MKQIQSYIDKKNEEFAKLPVFEFLKDRSIQPRQRLAIAPCMAH